MLASVIRSFASKETERIWRRERSRRFDASTQRAALRKLLILDAAERLGDLRIPARQPPRDTGPRPKRSTQHPGQPAMADLLHVDLGRA
jgi:hypothetical protein